MNPLNQISMLKNMIKKVADSLSDSHDDIMQVCKLIDRSMPFEQEIKQDLSTHDNQIYKDMLQNLIDKFNELEYENNCYKNNLAKLNKENEQYKSIISNIKDDIIKVKNEYDEIKDQYIKTESDLRRVNRECNLLRRANESLANECDKLNNRLVAQNNILKLYKEFKEIVDKYMSSDL